MAKAEWGLKRLCPSCGTRYYDMKKKPPVCPNCDTVFDPENLVRSRRGRAGADKKAAEAVAPEDTLDDLPIVEDDDADDALIEDAEELGDDEMDDVVDVEEEDA